MTQKEIDNFLANTKVYVAGKSKEIQEKLFSLGYKWNNGNANVDYTETPFLYIYESMSLQHGSDMEYFSNHEHREISAEEILSLELTESTYRPFKDKDECWSEMLKHRPFGWVKNICEYFAIICVYDHVYIDRSLPLTKNIYSFKEAYDSFNFADGTPFGIEL